jgi:hypothetical protein
MNKTFKHSGDLGDIIYSLPVIKQLGGGTLYLDITGGEDEEICKMQCIDGKTKFNKTSFDFIKPLLEVQPYINGVEIYQKNQKIDYNLNLFRYKFSDPNARSKTRNLLDLHMEAFGLPEWDPNEGWLQVESPVTLDRGTLVSRSPRMQSNFPWFQSNKFNFRDKAIFIGLPKEHEIFEYTFDVKIPYHQVKDALEIARVIAGCKAFVANSTFTLSVAIGLGTVNIVQEVEPHFPTTYFHGKKNMNYI